MGFCEFSSDQSNAFLLNALNSGRQSDIVEAVSSMEPVQIADFLITSDFKTHNRLFAVLGNAIDPEVLTFLDGDVLGGILKIMGTARFANLIAQLDDHDLLDVLRDFDNELRLQISLFLSESQKELVKSFLAYPEGSVGRLVNDKVVTVPVTWQVGEVLDFIRSNKELPQDLYFLLIVDSSRRLVGQVYLTELLRVPDKTLIKSVMTSDVRYISARADQADLVHIFRKYSLTSLPVVNDEAAVIGAISIDDVADIMRYEISDEIMKLGGAVGNINAGILSCIADRTPWLVANIFLSLLISYMVSLFNNTINSMVALVALLPIITSVGGCTASQSVSGCIRAIATREITSINIRRVAIKETFVALYLGVFLGLFSGLLVFLRYHDFGLCVLYVSAVIGIFLVASTAGLWIPVLLDRMNLDPAVVSPVIVSAAADAFAYAFVLGGATLMLL